MAAYYADTSVLVKRHVSEIGSAWVRALTSPASANVIITAQASLVEIYSALNRRVREQTVTQIRYNRIISVISVIWPTQYEVVPLTDALISETRPLLERYPLRAYDAVQLASAIQARRMMLAAGTSAPIFLSADGQLLSAARAEGFVTDNPNSHP